MSKRIVTALVAAALGFSIPVAHAGEPQWESSVPASFGINDQSCVPSGEIAEPVVLLHGTYNNAGVWKDLIPLLQEEGACVWAFDYGAEDVSLQNASPSTKAIADLDVAANEIAEQVDYVRAVTGAEKVDLVGHSQGGTHIKTYTQMHGGAQHVARAVALGGNFHGTTLNGQGEGLSKFIGTAPRLAAFLASTAGIQQVVGSEFMQRLNALPDTAPGVSYTSIYSPADKTVTPNSSSRLVAVDGADVVNLDLGEVCGVAPRHDRLPADKAALSQAIFGLKRAPGQGPDPATCASGESLVINS
ncbi:alpha/beta fold hydrolase [Corynebacterium sp. c8Ua_181]|uniref:Alpha/beta fold hydrolase n=1 Tax=Corynebacterium curieae TaxID=2913500 RepID=A0A9X3MAW5_9CORY|nr:alpha/beta fold hydrolase [Corynebacterium curieae]MCZ9306668.1 alpha/beta fold hydrolase [Corynebacterium curieae]MDV2423762.1 alpha/beta fold hydrolase [Corynebacterium curieae]